MAPLVGRPLRLVDSGFGTAAEPSTSGRTLFTKETNDAILQWTTAILLRRRPARKNHVPLVSYSRLVNCAHSSAGKLCGTGGRKIGNAFLRWAFAEAVCLLIRERPEAKRWIDRKEKKYGKGKALSLLAASPGRAVYWMLRRKEVFDWTAPLRDFSPPCPVPVGKRFGDYSRRSLHHTSPPCPVPVGKGLETTA